MTGKSTDTNKKKGGKEPDIIVALLTSYRDLTIYESNLYRVKMEDLSTCLLLPTWWQFIVVGFVVIL